MLTSVFGYSAPGRATVPSHVQTHVGSEGLIRRSLHHFISSFSSQQPAALSHILASKKKKKKKKASSVDKTKRHNLPAPAAPAAPESPLTAACVSLLLLCVIFLSTQKSLALIIHSILYTNSTHTENY